MKGLIMGDSNMEYEAQVGGNDLIQLQYMGARVHFLSTKNNLLHRRVVLVPNLTLTQ